LIISPGCQLKKKGTVITYPAIPGLETSDIYCVKVNGFSVWTEKLRTDFDLESLPDWFKGEPYVNQQQELHIANFSCDGQIDILLTVNENIDSISIHPGSRGIRSEVNDNVISFTLPGPDKLYIKVNNLPALCFFANPLENEVFDSTSENIMYFSPGVHRLGMIHPAENTIIYIAGGAIVYGGIETDGESNIRMLGRGILDGEFKYGRMVKPQNSSHLEFDGIIIRNGRSWTNTIINCDHVVYRNVKVISFRPGGDGINPLNSRHVTIDNCFFRCTDDCIAIKAPDTNQIAKDIRVINNTMVGFAYSDGCTIGFETNGPSISDVFVKNCDIIQARGGSRIDGHSAFSIICDGPSIIHNIRYEDIRVEADVLKLFELHITDGAKYGINPPGHIRGVHLKNILWTSERPIILHGFDKNHKVENVIFENCAIAGKPLNNAREDYFQINEFIENVMFK
jgi:hypothetical protein